VGGDSPLWSLLAFVSLCIGTNSLRVPISAYSTIGCEAFPCPHPKFNYNSLNTKINTCYIHNVVYNLKYTIEPAGWLCTRNQAFLVFNFVSVWAVPYKVCRCGRALKYWKDHTNMGVRRTFTRGGNSGFFQKVAFQSGAKSGKDSFYQLETKRKTFF